MAKVYATPWHRYKYLLSGLILILPVVFLYQSMNPVFPDALPEKTIGDFVVAPMPFDLESPYQHDGVYVKDFLLTFKAGNIAHIRQAVLNIGEQPITLKAINMSKGEEGFLHGSRHGQHVHGLANEHITLQDSIWLTIEQWNGQTYTVSWEVPAAML